MSTAELLRKAAGAMRERATAANDGKWWGAEPISHALSGTYSPPNPEADAAHIASWSPQAALEVAGWLDECAGVAEKPDVSIALKLTMTHRAESVARSYLGGES